MPYPAIYRARAVRLEGLRLTTFVPQVFGEAPIKIDSFLGSPPVGPGLGWVMFQGGNPEFPVWTGAAVEAAETAFTTRGYRWLDTTTATDPGHGYVKVNNANPAAATAVYLSRYDLNDEVFTAASSLLTGDLLAIYLNSDNTTRIDYLLTGPPVTTAGQWLTFPVSLSTNNGFTTTIPVDQADVQVVAQVAAHAPAPGGVAGDIIVKQSAAEGDSIWTTTMPKLSLNSMATVDLSSTTHSLTTGTVASTNLAIGHSRIQARNNGAASTLNLNPLGGTTAMGGAATVAGTLNVTGVTTLSQLSSLTLSGLMQVGPGEYIRANGAGAYQSWYTGASRIGYIQGNAAEILINSELGRLRLLGNDGITMSPFKINGYTAQVAAGGDTIVLRHGSGYIFANYFNMTANDVASWPDRYAGMAGGDNYIRWYQNVHSSHIRGGDLSIGGNISAGGNVSGSAVYASNWLRTTGTVGFYSDTYGVGIQPVAAGWLQMYGGHFALGDMLLRLRSYGDGNHGLWYSSAGAGSIHSSSGVGSNGAWLQGYDTIVLSTVSRTTNLANTLWCGNWFVDTSLGYQKFSSALIKDAIEPIDPAEALAQVNRWRPVTYIAKTNPDAGRIDGFIAEELHEVNPQLVVCVKAENETPEQIAERNADPERPSVGQPHALDYGQLTVRLTGAVQALTARIEELERKSA